MNTLIPLLVAAPLGVGFLIPLAVRVRTGMDEVLSNLCCFVLLLISVWLIGHETTYHMGGWPTPIGIDLRVDALTTLMLPAINFLALIVTVASVQYARQYAGRYRYYSLLMFVIAGTNGVVLTGDLFNLYVFLEIATVASYALVAFGGQSEDFEAAFKYVVIGSLSSSLILIGISLLYGMTGTLNMTHLASRFSVSESAAPLGMALGLFFCGFATKAALVPFHTWMPDAYPAAPAPISAMLSGVVSKVTGVYVLARLLFNVFGISDEMLLMMRWMGGITMVAGGFLALAQWDVKRLFAYSSISQVGLIVLTLGFGTTLGVVGGLFHLINHAVFKSLLFLGSGQLETTTGTRDLRQMHGLGQKLPVTAATTMVGSLSLAGIPPLNGFWSKLIIVIAAVQAGHASWATIVVVMSIFALAYQLKVQKHAFYSALKTPSSDLSSSEDSTHQTTASQEASEQPFARSVREPWSMSIPLILLAITCLASSLLTIGGLEHPFLIGPAADALIRGPWSP